MYMHPPVKMISLGLPMMVLLIAAVIGAVLAMSRRRTVVIPARRLRYPSRYPAAYPVVTPASSGGGRRYIWGVVIVLLVLTVGSYRLRSIPSQRAAVMIAESKQPWSPPLPPAYKTATTVVQPEDKAAPPAFQPEDKAAPLVIRPSEPPPHKRGNYLKPPPVNAPPHWQADFDHARVLSENENTDAVRLGTEVTKRLFTELPLRTLPPDHFVANPVWVRINETVRDAVQHDPQIGEYVHVRYHAELTADGWQELSRIERAARAEERMGFAVRGLGLMAVLLGAVAGYVRLDEWSKGYYSGRLFLAATALVAGAGWLVVTV